MKSDQPTSVKPSAFTDKASKPTEGQVARTLGEKKALWDQIRQRIAAQHDPLTEEWVFSGQKYGWSLRLKKKKRAVLYMTPLDGCFRIAFALGERAVQAAHQSDLSASVMNLIDSAPKYPEGRGVRMDVTSEKEVRVVEQLAAIKMAN